MKNENDKKAMRVGNEGFPNTAANYNWGLKEGASSQNELSKRPKNDTYKTTRVSIVWVQPGWALINPKRAGCT